MDDQPKPRPRRHTLSGPLGTPHIVPKAPADPAAPGDPPPPPGYDMRPIILRALLRGPTPPTGFFSVADFAEAVRAEFDLRGRPGEDWCREVLRKVDGVTEYPGGVLFKIQTG